MIHATREDIEILATFLGWKRLTWRDEPEVSLRGTPPGTLPDARATFPPSRLDGKDRLCDGNGMVWLIDEMHNRRTGHPVELLCIELEFYPGLCQFTPTVRQRGSLHRVEAGGYYCLSDTPQVVIRLVVDYLKRNSLIPQYEDGEG